MHIPISLPEEQAQRETAGWLGKGAALSWRTDGLRPGGCVLLGQSLATWDWRVLCQSRASAPSEMRPQAGGAAGWLTWLERKL